jgi:hypothetical protein
VLHIRPISASSYDEYKSRSSSCCSFLWFCLRLPAQPLFYAYTPDWYNAFTWRAGYHMTHTSIVSLTLSMLRALMCCLETCTAISQQLEPLRCSRSSDSLFRFYRTRTQLISTAIPGVTRMPEWQECVRSCLSHACRIKRGFSWIWVRLSTCSAVWMHCVLNATLLWGQGQYS